MILFPRFLEVPIGGKKESFPVRLLGFLAAKVTQKPGFTSMRKTSGQGCNEVVVEELHDWTNLTCGSHVLQQIVKLFVRLSRAKVHKPTSPLKSELP